MAAALRRSNTYCENVTDNEKRAFREDICGELEEIAKQYTTTVDDQTHLKNIKRLQKFAKRHKDILAGKELRVGIAQKALNLYLKLQWALGNIKEPPHCPLDAIIIKKLQNAPPCKWTELNNFGTYEALIQAARELADAKGQSIAVWELEEYQAIET